ncbi:hypothetical protein MCOR02_012122 [Pyricularia oryzae]|nr:hypothetical protein MCOR02_012122 [Pyricularia oryzae]KAI6443775.1 hypothetical protein MCOR17_011347 [Pyricularia oryzae]
MMFGRLGDDVEKMTDALLVAWNICGPAQVHDPNKIYLDPKSEEWYANHGIPLRRGYLFHGPPGTGKTSLSLALADFFGLDIYVINLAEPALTDNSLLELANDVPERCIVLLENIDTVGLKRFEVKKLKQIRESSGRLAKRNGVTIGGVLNAFDGAASQEGRVLILATNKPASLDEALIRPGRVDLKLRFDNITKNHARDLFWRMYTPDTSAETNELVKLAAEFGCKISEKIFSPAEVPNYLIMHKDQPRQALSGVTDWVEAMKQKSRRHRGKPCAKVPTKCRKKMKRVRYAY